MNRICKKIMAVFLALAVAAGTVYSGPVSEQASAASSAGTIYGSYSTNLAKNAAAYASSNARGDQTIGARQVANLTDTSNYSYIVLHPDDTDPWFYVDLGSGKNVNKVSLVWGAVSYSDAYAASYKVQYSDDASVWMDAASMSDGALGSVDVTFPSVYGRYIRVLVTGKASEYVSLYEMRVYETNFGVTAGYTNGENYRAGSGTANVASGQTAYASSNDRNGSTGEIQVNNLTDNNTLTYIVSHYDDANPYFYVDLGALQNINKAVVYFGSDSSPYTSTQPGAYDLQVSSDGTNWTTVKRVLDASYGKTTVHFGTVWARYVRVSVTDKWDGTNYVSMYELKVFNTDFSSAVPDYEEDPVRILFIGNSLTCYNNVSSKVQSMFEMAGHSAHVDVLINLGQTLNYHASLSVTGETILNGNYDYVVLQDKASGFSASVLQSGAENLYYNYIQQSGAIPVLYMIWANADVLTATQSTVTAGYVSTAESIGAKLAPAGVCWLDFYNNGYNWYSDNIHANAIGSYMAAANIYYAITGAASPLTVTASDEVVTENSFDVDLVNTIHEKACTYAAQYNSDNPYGDTVVSVADGAYYLQGVNTGKIVCAENYGDDILIANRDSYGGGWETLTIVNNEDGTISLLSGANNKYVCMVYDESCQLLARSSEIGTWEKFYLVQVTDDQYALRSSVNNLYVTVNENDSNNLYATAGSVQAWEVFYLYTTSGEQMTASGSTEPTDEETTQSPETETDDADDSVSGSITDGITVSGGIDDFKIVGYTPNWYGTGYLDNIDYSQVTHLIYAFAIPTTSGTILSLNDGGFMEALVSKAHANGVKVSIAIGGWSYNGEALESTFAEATNTDAKCKTLADAMLAVVDRYGLDGIDVDWEYPRSDTSWQFETLIQYLREGLNARGDDMVLTAAVSGTYTTGYSQTALSMLDWVNIMAYDGDSSSGHSPYSYAVTCTEVWKNMGLSQEKLVLGVPFYERPNWASYADIVAADAGNAYKDSTVIGGTAVYYNGLNTIAEKTAYACENAGGIMIWEMSQDSTDKDLSLLNRIYTTALENLSSTAAPVMTDVSMSQTAVLTPDLAYNTSGSMKPASMGAYGDYFINVKDAGAYTLTYSVTGEGSGIGYESAISVYIGEPGTRNLGSTAASTVTIPGLWTTSAVKISVPITLEAGEQVIRIGSNAAGYTLVQAEIAKQAESVINLAVGESTTIGADKFAASEGNYVIIDEGLEYTVAGNAFDYHVTVANAGNYSIRIKYGLESASNVVFGLDMVTNETSTALGTVSAPATGAWTVYGDTEALDISLPAGSYVLRMTITGDGANIMSLDVTRNEGEEITESETSAEEPSTEESSSEESTETLVMPSKVTGLQALYENGQIQLTWDDNGADMYKVARSDGRSSYINLTYKATAAGWTDTQNLVDAQLYYYRVIGYFKDAEGNLVMGEMSDAVAVVATDGLPAKISNLAYTISGGNVTLTWDQAVHARYYKVSRAAGATGKYYTMKYNIETTVYSESSVASNLYRYKVVGYYKDVDGSWVYGDLSDTLYVTVN